MTLEEEEQLRAENANLKAQVADLKAQFAQLSEKLAQVQAQSAQNSHNSSKPSLSDGFNRPPKNPKERSLRQITGKKPGGQAGHEDHHLAWDAKPDQVITSDLAECSNCHTDLSQVEPIRFRSRQVLDLPPELKLYTVEHQANTKACPKCS